MLANRWTGKTHKVLTVVAVVAVLVVLYSLWYDITAPAEAVAAARRYAQLAPLPASATAVRAEHYHSFFSANAYVKFTAPARDIEAFLAASPGLSRVKPERFTPKHMYVPYPRPPKVQFRDEKELEASLQHRHFSPGPLPSWFDPTIRILGRRFVIPQDREAYGGEVVIDDINRIVFIRASYS